MNIYAVIDTNVIVSAMLSKKDTSATVIVIEKMIRGEITPVYSDEIIEEYRNVLWRKKFDFDSVEVEDVLSVIIECGLKAEPSASGLVIPDMTDLPFYEVVMEKRDDGAYLVTGNKKHFPIEPFVVTAREFLDILGSKK